MLGRSTHESVPIDRHALDARTVQSISGAGPQEVHLEDPAVGLATAVVTPNPALDDQPPSRKVSQAVSSLGLVCMELSFGYSPPVEKEQGILLIRAAVDLGVTFLTPLRCMDRS